MTDRNKFTATRAALVQYDLGQRTRDAMSDRARTDADVDAWQDAEKAALRLVQEAFHQDTQHVNSLDHCYLADIPFMRQCVRNADDPNYVTAQERREFRQYLKACTDAQVEGVLEKETAAGREVYMGLARNELDMRQLAKKAGYK